MIPNRPLVPSVPTSPPSRSALGRLLMASALSIVISLIPIASQLLYPLRLFVTFIHEGSHALAAALTGGQAFQINVMPDASGVTLTSGGWETLIVMAGYVGASAYGAVMLALARRPGTARIVLGASGIIIALLDLLLVRNGFGLGWGIVIALGLLFAARRLSTQAAELTAMFLGVQCVLNSLYDLKTLVGLSTLPNGPVSDAVLMSQIIPFPPLVWAVFWGLLSLGILGAALRPYWRDAQSRKALFTAIACLFFIVPAGTLRAETISPFTWGDTTKVASAGWGRMIPLHGHDWLCVDNLYPKPNSVWQLEISHDDARTWTPITTVAEPGRSLDNGEIIQLPNGSLLLTGRSVIAKHTPGIRQSYHLPVYRSADDGKTWNFLSQVAVSEPPPYATGQPSQGLWEPHFFLLPGGAVACAYADETQSAAHPAYSQIVSEKVSRDSGATWGPAIVLAAQIGGGGQRPGMPVVTRMKNGRYLAVYEVVGIGDADIYFKTSRDGTLWEPGIGTIIPGQHAGPWVTSLKSGRLVVTSCENRISYSDDLGATWLLTFPSADPFGHVFSWPAVYEISPNQIAVMTSWHGVNIRWGHVNP